MTTPPRDERRDIEEGAGQRPPATGARADNPVLSPARLFNAPAAGIPGVGFPARGCAAGVSSDLDRVRLPGLTYGTWRSCGGADGTAAPWWRCTPGASPPGGWNEEYEPEILPGDGSAACPGLPRPTWNGAPAALGLGPAWLVLQSHIPIFIGAEAPV